MDALLTAEEAAQVLRCTPTWLVRAAQRGEVPSRKVGRRRLFTHEDLAEFVDRSKQGSDPWARSPRSEAKRRRT